MATLKFEIDITKGKVFRTLKSKGAVKVYGLMFLALITLAICSLFKVNHSWLYKFALAEYAHIKAGEKVPFNVEWTDGKTPDIVSWGIDTNSQLLVDWTLNIVPYFVYENVTTGNGNYPVLIGFVPYQGRNSMGIGGQTFSDYSWVIINSRYVTDPTWNDAREVLSVLVHELVHMQLGAFIGWEPEVFEAKTQVATLETLAGMCNNGWDLACKTYWYEIESYTRASMNAEMKTWGLGGLYQKIADIFWRNSIEERAAAKSARQWVGNEEDLAYVLRAYYLNPWEIVTNAVLNHECLLTGHYDFETANYEQQCMPFDDTRALLGPFWIKIISFFDE